MGKKIETGLIMCNGNMGKFIVEVSGHKVAVSSIATHKTRWVMFHRATTNPGKWVCSDITLTGYRAMPGEFDTLKEARAAFYDREYDMMYSNWADGADGMFPDPVKRDMVAEYDRMCSEFERGRR